MPETITMTAATTNQVIREMCILLERVYPAHRYGTPNGQVVEGGRKIGYSMFVVKEDDSEEFYRVRDLEERRRLYAAYTTWEARGT